VRNVFVYGSLKKGFHNNYLLGKSKLVAEGTLPRVKMLRLWGFPGLVDGKGGAEGEVYEIDDLTLATLDRLEGVAYGFYKRETREVDVKGSDKKMACEVYLYGREIGDEEVVESGVWK
jgi:gamma-glutamylcyclotransferase (GGCT)/AIG2-like uncharacterized protein YtfP